MARRWLLTVLTGTALSLGFAGTAGAQELDPVTVDTGVATATATADTTERTLEAEVATDATVEEADTEVSPDATAAVSPDGADLDVDGTTEVAGTPLPIPQAARPVEDAAGEPTGQSGAGSDVTPAPALAGPAPTVAGPAPVGDQPRSSSFHSRPLSADGATARSGMWAETTTYTYEEGSILAPEVAPPAEALPLVAAAAPVATDLSLPIIDTTPTVPALLRLLAGLLVVGAAVTWQTVRSELA